MNFYKKIIRSQNARFAILKFLRFIPDKPMLRLQYFLKLKRWLKLKHPTRYTEKLQWYKLYYRNPVMHTCVDKYRVREYIHSKGLDEILNELYAVGDHADEINFDALPNEFIIKTTNGSGTNIICRDKANFDIPGTRQQMDAYLVRTEASAGREWAYSGATKKIIVEALLKDPTTPDGAVCDYKFLCFGGKPYCVVYDKDRYTGHKRNFYDLNWKRMDVGSDCPNFDDEVEKPRNFERMLEIASILSEDFPAVRVDLYNIEGRIVFGELTFYPWSGYVQFTPDSFDLELGRQFNIENT
ncbi:MAG: carbonic anhydrase [Clostridia bacterium]|nr:carbonic anhydrase [Clostridia bacterium]